MKADNQVLHKTIKMTAQALSLISYEKKIVSDGLDLTKYEDGRTPDGYILMRAERVDSINDDSARKLAKSLSIKQLTITKAVPELIQHLRLLLGLSKAEVDSNNIFFAIHTENDFSQVVMFWKCY